MKFLSQLMAAMLLWILIACNNTTEKQKQSDIALQEIKQEEVKMPPPPPPYNNGTKKTETQNYTSPVVVKDETITQDSKGIADDGVVAPANKAFNTEDYDHIVENKFLASIQNPLSTFSIDVDEAAYSNIRR